MYTAITIDDHLIEKAERLTGVHQHSALMTMAINALIEREANHHPGTRSYPEPNAAPPAQHTADYVEWCCPDA